MAYDVIVGPPESGAIRGSRASTEQWDLKHEILDTQEIRRRFPAMRPAPDEIALYEEGAGFVVPENAVRAHLELARKAGAELHFEEPVTHWEEGRVTTATATYEAEHIVLCPGPWAPQLVEDLPIPFGIERQVQYFFHPTENFRDHPIYIWDRADGTEFCGLALDGAVKVAFHSGGPNCTASSSCPSSARSSPTSRSTGPRGTRSHSSTLFA